MFLPARTNIKIAKSSLYLERALFYFYLGDLRAVYSDGVNGEESRTCYFDRIARKYDLCTHGRRSSDKRVPYKENGDGDKCGSKQSLGRAAVGKPYQKAGADQRENESNNIVFRAAAAIGLELDGHSVRTGDDEAQTVFQFALTRCGDNVKGGTAVAEHCGGRSFEKQEQKSSACVDSADMLGRKVRGASGDCTAADYYTVSRTYAFEPSVMNTVVKEMQKPPDGRNEGCDGSSFRKSGQKDIGSLFETLCGGYAQF